VKKKLLYAVLAALGLCVAAEAFCRSFPSLLPHHLNVLRIKYLLQGRYTVKDEDLGHILAAGFHQVFQWRGRRLEIRTEAFPGQSRAGYRVDSRTLGQTQADIAAVGDSLTNAAEVDQDSTWPSRLGVLAGFRVANLGTPAFSTAQMAESFRRYGSKLRPKLAVLFLCSDDPLRNRMFHSWRLLESRKDSILCLTAGLSGAACRGVESLARSGILPKLALERLLLRLRIAHMIDPKAAADGMELTYRALDEMRSLASSQGGGFCVILHDSWNYTDPALTAGLTAFLQSKGIPVMNLGLRSKYPGVKMEVALDGHLNELGNALAAAEIHRFLRKNQLLPKGGTRWNRSPR